MNYAWSTIRKNTSKSTIILSHNIATHSDAASMVFEVACPSPMGVMFRGTGLLLGAISITTQ